MFDATSPLLVHRALAVLLVAFGLSACDRDESAPEGKASDAQVWVVESAEGLYRLALSPREGRALIGEFQDWVIEVQDIDGAGQYPTRVFIDGGMPEHGHGLPTRPQVTEHLGDGRYLVEGMRFNMAGDWILQLAVEGPIGRDSAQLELELAF